MAEAIEKPATYLLPMELCRTGAVCSKIVCAKRAVWAGTFAVCVKRKPHGSTSLLGKSVLGVTGKFLNDFGRIVW